MVDFKSLWSRIGKPAEVKQIAGKYNLTPEKQISVHKGVHEERGPYRWHDLFHLSMADDQLCAHVKGFLNFLQQSAFYYDEHNYSTGQTEELKISGQDMLQRCYAYQSLYQKISMDKVLEKLGAMKNGKFIISQHNNTVQGTIETTSHTSIMEANGTLLPKEIVIGTDFLRRGFFTGIDGITQRISIDQITAHELGHFCYAVRGEIIPPQIESIIIGAMGGPIAGTFEDIAAHRVPSYRDSIHDYHTLYDKVELLHARLEIKRANIKIPQPPSDLELG